LGLRTDGRTDGWTDTVISFSDDISLIRVIYQFKLASALLSQSS